jgi:hypothetical protein
VESFYWPCAGGLGREFRLYSGAPPATRRNGICRNAGIPAEFRRRLIQRSMERKRGSKYHMVPPKYALIPANSATYVIPANSAGGTRNPEFRTEFRRNSLAEPEVEGSQKLLGNNGRLGGIVSDPGCCTGIVTPGGCVNIKIVGSDQVVPEPGSGVIWHVSWPRQSPDCWMESLIATEPNTRCQRHICKHRRSQQSVAKNPVPVGCIWWDDLRPTS